MCGIVGVITNKENSYNLEDIILKMADKISHRMTSSGTYFDTNKSFYLAHQRLSIIDLSKTVLNP